MALGGTAWAKLRGLVAGWRRARWQRARDERLSGEMTERMLADAALSRADVGSLRHAARDDMSRMMAHFGADPADIPPEFRGTLRDAERVCAACLAVGRCRRWLHRHATDDAPRLFCPNAELFDDLAYSQRLRRRTDDPPKR